MERYKIELNEMVRSTFVSECEQITGSKDAEATQAYLKANLVFVTVTVLNARSRQPEEVLREFPPFYKEFCKLTVGSHFRRKLGLQPLAFYCLDEEGSRYHKVNLSKAQFPHIHALMLLRPEIRSKWFDDQKAIILYYLNQLQDFKVLSFDPGLSSFPDLISYVTKGLRREATRGIYYDFLPGRFRERSKSIENWSQRYKPRHSQQQKIEDVFEVLKKRKLDAATSAKQKVGNLEF